MLRHKSAIYREKYTGTPFINMFIFNLIKYGSLFVFTGQTKNTLSCKQQTFGKRTSARQCSH